MNIKDLGVNYLLVNATNRFLLEYAPIEENSCHNLTGFTGDTGDSLVLPDGGIKLFVDGRYHTQADLEVDKNKVEVVKLKLGQKQDDAICDSISPHCVLGIVGAKVSQYRFEYLKTLLNEIDVKVKLLDVDIFEKPYKKKISKVVSLPLTLTGADFKTKIKSLKKPVLVTNSEELSYLCNIRDFDQHCAVKVDGKLLITKDRNILFTDAEIKSNEFKVLKTDDFKSYIKNIDDKILVDKKTINAEDYSLIKNVEPASSQVKHIKSVKNETEIEHLKHCFEMTDKALFDTRQFIYENDNISEYDIDVELEKNFKKYGAKLLSFQSIIARNKNAALAHYMKSSKDEIIKDGDLVLIDCGAYYDGGLATDITRVFVKENHPSCTKKFIQPY